MKSTHFINDDGQMLSEAKITEYLGEVATRSGFSAGKDGSVLRSVGVNYHVVGVFGGQSSGKSTLLNHLFATDFQTLDETVRRGQTTKGAFMSAADESLEGFTGDAAAAERTPLLVVDFEGTDGLERGENQSFERQLSLFGLSIADTLIINMWAVDVGRFNAANLSLLRTIFEVNLQLFSHDSYAEDEKPTLLIVLRDFTDDDPAPSLLTIRKSFDTIWENITRPDKFADSPIDALFRLKYFFMPHYKLQKEQFQQSVTRLRHWFGDAACEDYLFRHRAMFRGVPLEGLPAYALSCWAAIQTSKDLDIPTQREMLAQHRCKDTQEQELRAFLACVAHYEERLGRGEMLLRLSEVLEGEMVARAADYRRATVLYHSDVVRQYGELLEREMGAAALRVVNRVAKAVAAEVMGGVETRAQAVVERALRHFLQAAQSQPLLPPPSGEPDAPPRVDNERARALTVSFWEQMREGLRGLLGELAADPPASNLYGRYTSLVAQDPVARLGAAHLVAESLVAKLEGRLRSMADAAHTTLHRNFEECLSRKPDGTVQYFTTSKNFMAAVPPAQQAGLLFMNCLLYLRLHRVVGGRVAAATGKSAALVAQSPIARQLAERAFTIELRDTPHDRDFFFAFSTLAQEPEYPLQVPVVEEGSGETDGVDGEAVLLSVQVAQKAFELFTQKCDFTIQLQLRTLEANKQRLPAWVFPALLLLGANEIWYVCTHPVLLITVIVIVFVFFKGFVEAQWQAFEESGPPVIVMPIQMALQHVGRVWRSIAPAGQGPTHAEALHKKTDGDAATGRAAAKHADPATKAHTD